jgi:succinate dehydrogenase hydrophobic anchor subunit
MRATAIAAALLLVAHLFTEVHIYGEGLSALWDTDGALDKCFWVVVFLLIVSAFLPNKATENDKPN